MSCIVKKKGYPYILPKLIEFELIFVILAKPGKCVTIGYSTSAESFTTEVERDLVKVFDQDYVLLETLSGRLPERLYQTGIQTREKMYVTFTR